METNLLVVEAKTTASFGFGVKPLLAYMGKPRFIILSLIIANE